MLVDVGEGAFGGKRSELRHTRSTAARAVQRSASSSPVRACSLKGNPGAVGQPFTAQQQLGREGLGLFAIELSAGGSRGNIQGWITGRSAAILDEKALKRSDDSIGETSVAAVVAAP